MSRKIKMIGLMAGLAMLMCAAPAAVSAKPTSGMDIVPIIDRNYWQLESKETSHLPLDGEGGYASATVDENGAITVKRTKNAKATTVSVHSMPVEMRPDLNLEENPYLYFDLTCNTNWKIILVVNNENVNIAAGITNAVAGSEEVTRQSKAGSEGTYTGKFNLYEYLNSTIVTRELSSLKNGVKTCRAPQIYLTLVDNTADHLSGELTVRRLSIGNDDENAAEGLKVSGELAVGSDEDFADLIASNTTQDPSRIIFADGATATQKNNSTGGTGNSDNTALYVVIAVCVVVVLVVVAVVLAKKKGGSPDVGGDTGGKGPADVPPDGSQDQTASSAEQPKDGGQE